MSDYRNRIKRLVSRAANYRYRSNLQAWRKWFADRWQELPTVASYKLLGMNETEAAQAVENADRRRRAAGETMRMFEEVNYEQENRSTNGRHAADG